VSPYKQVAQMAKYEAGITDINVVVRLLGYASAILGLLEHKTLSESMLYTRLEKWSLDHKKDFMAYPIQQGFINATRQQTGPKRYTNLVVSLGLIGHVAGACRVTRFGKILLPFLRNIQNNNPFELTDVERCAYLYWLLLKDTDQLLTVFRMLAEERFQSLSGLQKSFHEFYLQQLYVRMRTAENHVAPDILSVRNRVEHWEKASRRSVENIVPPRVHWLSDLGLVSIGNNGKIHPKLTVIGSRFYQTLPIIQGTKVVYTNPMWLRKKFFGIAGEIFTCGIEKEWTAIQNTEKTICYTNSLFKLLTHFGVHLVQRFRYILHLSI
jgi:hypothetical protein